MPDTPKTVLVVDDHLDTCELLVRLLQISGYLAVCVESGPEALAFLGRRKPDLMILDMMMPGMSGLDVLRAVRARPDAKDVPVLMYTANTDPEVARSAIDLGAQDCLVKGRMLFEELKRIVQRHLN
jgi:two-component system sensor histidine kinase ChiS